MAPPSASYPVIDRIGVSTWPASHDIVKLIDRIRITRELQTVGFAVFNSDVSVARDTMPLCGVGITQGR